MSIRRVSVRFSRVVAVLTAFAVTLLVGAMPAAADTAMVTLSGHITGPDAAGVDGGQVAVWCSGLPSPVTTSSAADGFWSVQVPQGASCYVEASKIAADLLLQYYPTSTMFMTIAADTADIDMQLEQGGAVAGRGTVPAGYAAERVTVYGGALRSTVVVGADGTYVIHGLKVGTHHASVRLSVGSDLYADPADYPYVVTAGATTSGVDFTAHVGASITGVVTRADGTPVRSVAAEAVTAGGKVVGTAFTDASGHYTLHGLRPGSYVVQFYAEGLADPYYPNVSTNAAATTFELTDEMSVTADQTVYYTPEVAGHAVDVSGAPVAGVAVSLEPVSGSAAFDAGTTRSDGSFDSRVPNLTAGSYRVRFVPPAGSGYGPTYFGGRTRAQATVITLAAYDSTAYGLDVVLPPEPGRYVPQPPVRVLDTRAAVDGPLRAGEFRAIALDPGDTKGLTAAVLNITTTRTVCGTTYISAGPNLSSAVRPSTSVVNARAFADVPNMVTVQVAPGGLVTLYSNSCDTDVVVDLEGYYTASGGAGYVPAPSPCRVLDTRSTATPFRAGETRRVDLSGVVPKDAVAAMVTLTSTRATGITYLSAFPTGATGGTGTSVVNAVPGADIANSAPVQVAPDGSISVYNNAGQVDVIVDVVGWYTATGGADFWPLEPARTASSGALDAAQTRLVATPDERIPADAVAVALNLTTTNVGETSYLVAYPAAGERPATSNGNARAGLDVANGTVVAVSDGGYRVYNNAGTVTILEDVFGYFASAT